MTKIYRIKKFKSFDIIETEYFDGKPLLFNRIKNKKHIAKELINSVYMLIRNNLVHCDLRPSNILIKNYELKLVDFEFCNKSFQKFWMEGSVYIPPEIEKGNTHKYSDLYSVGVILFLMLNYDDVDIKLMYKESKVDRKSVLNKFREKFGNDKFLLILSNFLMVSPNNRHIPYSAICKIINESNIH